MKMRSNRVTTTLNARIPDFLVVIMYEPSDGTLLEISWSLQRVRRDR